MYTLDGLGLFLLINLKCIDVLENRRLIVSFQLWIVEIDVLDSETGAVSCSPLE